MTNAACPRRLGAAGTSSSLSLESPSFSVQAVLSSDSESDDDFEEEAPEREEAVGIAHEELCIMEADLNKNCY